MKDNPFKRRSAPDGFIPVQQHNRTVITLVALCCLSIGIAIGAITRGIAGAKSEDNHLTISQNSMTPDELSAAFAKVATRVEPCVVHIGVTEDQSLEAALGHEGTGSGIIVNPAGYILTNLHVVAHSSKISVKLFDGQEFRARVVGQDSDTDLAVIKIDAHQSLPAAVMGNSDDLRVGDWVLAIGSPFGFDQTVTAGIISAKDRVTNPGAFFQQFLQTDAAINPGNSGGPLVNLAGEVVGINTLIATRTWVYNGIGFALPSQTAVDIYNQLIQFGRVRRGFLGITLQPVTPQVERLNGLKDAEGVLVGDVTSRTSPAARAGIQSEDVIVAINGQKIKDVRDLIRTVGMLPVGSVASVKFLRGGQVHTVSVRLEERVEDSAEAAPESIPRQVRPPSEQTSPTERGNSQPGRGSPNDKRNTEVEPDLTPTFGLAVKSLAPDKAREMGMEGARGALVTDIQRGSLAWNNGLQQEDVVIDINRKPVNDAADFMKLAKQLKSGDDVVIRVIRRADLGSSPPITSYIASFTIP